MRLLLDRLRWIQMHYRHCWIHPQLEPEFGVSVQLLWLSASDAAKMVTNNQLQLAVAHLDGQITLQLALARVPTFARWLDWSILLDQRPRVAAVHTSGIGNIFT